MYISSDVFGSVRLGQSMESISCEQRLKVWRRALLKSPTRSIFLAFVLAIKKQQKLLQKPVKFYGVGAQFMTEDQDSIDKARERSAPLRNLVRWRRAEVQSSRCKRLCVGATFARAIFLWKECVVATLVTQWTQDRPEWNKGSKLNVPEYYISCFICLGF